MSSTIIKVENLSKQYRLGRVGTGTLSHDLNRLFHKILGKEDPYLKIGQENDRTMTASSEYVWALRDLNFEIDKGEVIGIIGRNGAGKSTLLKILSRITAPSSGRVYINGRIASLLEVGTGFHPELTGRENIFLNGAILGMRKHEIRKKFDEIVDFAGVAAYIDTPVKRYSSGMYVRLAFAVAAFLEPDILIVDEVLAVGDMEFQNKCIGRMKDVSLHEGRTVLFVSHNMAAIQNLCTRALLMDKGKLVESGTVPDIMDAYLKKYAQQMSQADLNNVKRLGNKSLIFEQLYISQDGQREIQNIETFKEVQFNFHFKISPGVNVKTGRIDIGINDIFGVRIAWMSTSLHNQSLSAEHSSLSFDFKNFNLAPGSYNCTVYAEVNGEIADYLFGVMGFNVVEKDYYQTGRTPPKNQGNFLIQFESHLS